MNRTKANMARVHEVPLGHFTSERDFPPLILVHAICEGLPGRWPIITNELPKALSLTSRRYCGFILQQKCEWK